MELPDSPEKRRWQQALLDRHKTLVSNTKLLERQDVSVSQEQALMLLKTIEQAMQIGDYAKAHQYYAAFNKLMQDRHVLLPGMGEVKLAHLQQHLQHTKQITASFQQQWNSMLQARKQFAASYKVFNLAGASACFEQMLSRYAALPQGSAWKKAMAEAELTEFNALLKKGRKAFSTIARTQMLLDRALSWAPSDPGTAREFYVHALDTINALPAVVLDMHPELLERLTRAYSQLLMQEIPVAQRSTTLKLAQSLATMQDHVWTRDFALLRQEYAHACSIANTLQHMPRKLMRDLEKMKTIATLHAAVAASRTPGAVRTVMQSCRAFASTYPEERLCFAYLARLANIHYLILNNTQDRDNIRRRISAGEQ